MERSGDVIVVSPTGSGESLLWVLPLLARQGGILLVVTPYTSLGLASEIRCDANTYYHYLMLILCQKSWKRHSVIIYIC